MKWTGLNELREKYLAFFEEKGHLRLDSFPLVPINDNSLLLINSGMAPMKKYFTGEITPPRNRVTTCQKCIRTPDIENVGKTARHGTFFEMLGNFSFGDYFKKEATAWAWEFFTKVLEMPEEKLYVSIYLEDDEAYEIWTKEVGVDPSHMVRMGKEDNFWEHGTGPCGPCSEIYFDRGPEKGCGSPDCKVGCECDRFVEVWNLVFSQFDSDGNGNYATLAQKNIDTGMGLERLACMMQGVDNLFEVDTMQKIMAHISRIAGVSYKEDAKQDVSLRVMTDHIRSTTFMIADGVIPSNEGRGYVLRRLLRRAARHGRLLGVTKPFLFEVVDTVVEENKSAYPELAEKQAYIKKMVQTEEENFAKTIGKGFELLNHIIDSMETGEIFSGADAFKLYDTYGFPIDLTREIISERNLAVDEEAFVKLMEEQRIRARNARTAGDAFGGGSTLPLEFLDGQKTEFLGYTDLNAKGKVLGIICEGEKIDSAISPQQIVVITDKTPFYAESGGQVADKGEIFTHSCSIRVYDVRKSASGDLILHFCEVTSGQLNVGEEVNLSVSSALRRAIARNHTCAHLLQSALRNVLGDHVHQAGQLVNAERLRFDFSHFEGMTAEQLSEVEHQINRVILSGIEVERYETDIDTAKSQGAMALFGEKYGDTVRICKVSDYSMELCGGTHVENTSNIGLFKILFESSVAAGVRRIEGVTGHGVLELIRGMNLSLQSASDILKANNPSEIIPRAEAVMSELKEKNQAIDALNRRIAETQVKSFFDNIQKVGDTPYITAMLMGTSSDSLRIMAEKIRESAPNCVALLCGLNDSKGTFICSCGENAVKRGLHAGKLVSQAAAITGGKGGGRPELAMAGVTDSHKVDEALLALPKFIEAMVK